jgi:amino acid adenylation domain-containing protein
VSSAGVQELSEAKRKLLARMLSGQAPSLVAPEDGIAPRPRAQPGDAEAPLSVDQLSVWLHASSAGPTPIYNEPVTLHRHGPLDPIILERSLSALLQRHELWRCRVVLRDGQAMLAPAADVALPLAYVDLTGLPEAEREAAAIRAAAEDARVPIDLGRAPLFRVRVFRLSATRHRISFTLHHLIFDGVTVHRLLPRDLAEFYAAFAEGRAANLPALPVQYGDYTVWREAARGRPSVLRQLEHWRVALANEPDPIRLPSDRSRPATPGFAGGGVRFAVPPALMQRVRALARAEGATVYMVTLAAFKAMLHRYGGQDDLIVGTIVDLRRRPELRDLLGYFLNAVALRTHPRADLPFRAYLAEVRAALLAALDASEVPFDDVVRAVAPRRDPGAHPLFQVLFSIQPPPEAPPEGWDFTQMDVPTQVTKFDLYLELEERTEGLIGRFIFSRDLFDEATIERMVGHYLTLLDSVTGAPETPLRSLAMLTGPERQHLLHDWNRSAAELPADNIWRLIAAQVLRVPDAVAVETDDRRLTYAELDRRSAALCAALRRAGARPGAVAAVCAARTPDLVVALLAVLRSGAAYLPLDPALPRARFTTLLEDARPAVMVTQVDLLTVLPPIAAPLILLDDLDVAAPPDADPEDVPEPAADDIAYVLYTSGSTGTPKGVEIGHRSLVNLIVGFGRLLEACERDVLLAITTISFDIAALELFLPLTLGGRVVLASRDDAVDPWRLIALIGRVAPTLMQATPATWRGLLGAGWAGQAGLTIVSGGEAMPRSLARELLARTRAVWNGYGPTETTIYSSAHRVDPAEQGIVPIGRPVANTQLYVLDPQGELLPAGVPGELHIGGVGLARGYRGRPDLTAARFVTRSGVPGVPLYATGDLVRQRADGQIEWLGRIDTQVKVRGYRVELGEVTETLVGHPDVAAAAVVDYRDAGGETGLLAGVVVRPGAALAAADLRGFLRLSLPEYVVPARYVFVAALPLTPNGKVDRFALHAMAEQEDRPAPTEQVLSPAALALAPIWRKVLGLRHADPADNFFEVGGHSLLAAKLLGAIEARFGHRLAMADIFRAPTMGEIAGMLPDPDAAPPRPAEPSVADRDATRHLLGQFESIGEDCEFGLLQRRFGSEPLALFRFAAAPLATVIAALEADLVRIDEPDLLDISYDEGQRTSLARHRTLTFGYLLFDRPDTGDLPALKLREARRLGFLRRKLFEDLTRGEKIWVLKNRHGFGEGSVRHLLRLLRARGPARLLWVEAAAPGQNPGEVMAAGDGLLRGWVDRFAPADAMQNSTDVWIEVCRRAQALVAGAQAS